MNINELKAGIDNHKKRSPKTYDECLNFTLPLYIFHRKLMDGVCNLQEKKYGLSNIELDVLASLVMGGGEEYILSPTELYARLLFSSGGMTKVLKKLEDKAYIQRLENSEDKRSKLVKLTPLGKELCEKALKDVISYESKYFACLDKNEKNILKDILFKILQNND